MQTSPIELDNYEVTPNRAKYPPSMNLSQSDSSHAAETYAAEGLSQVNTLKLKQNMDNSNGNGGTIVTSANTPENALAPQKVRTERYVKVSVKGMPVARSKSLFLSWFLDNNGLPDCCLLLIPERHPNVIISFKGTHGWIEIDAAHCKAPEYEIQFELKLHHAFLNRRRYVQNQPIVLRFFLLDKREDGTINNLGEVLLSVLLMSSKCANRTLIAHFIKDDKQRDLSMQIPMAPLVDRKSYEIDQDDNNQLQVPNNLTNNNNNNSNNNSNNNNNLNVVAANYAAMAHHHHIPPHHYSNHMTMANNNSNNPNTNTSNGMSPHQQHHQQHNGMGQQAQHQLGHSHGQHPHAHHSMVQHHMGVHTLNPQVLSHPQLLQQTQAALYAQPIYTGNQN